MKQFTAEDHVKPRQALRTRFLWFLAGAGLNYLLISTPLHWLERNTELHKFVIAALSVGCATTFFFFWNYFINFRTDRRKRDALPRYVTAVVCMWLLSSTLLAILKHFDAQMAFSIGGIPLDLDIVATQFFLAGLKFSLYHKWVFPVPKEEPITPAPRTDELGKAG
jgi:putative flippase GtrA